MCVVTKCFDVDRNRAQALGAGTRDHCDVVKIRVLAAYVIECIDQYDVVVHHDTCQCNDTDAGQQRAERTAGNKQAYQDTSSRHDNSKQDQHTLVQAVELRDQNNRHNGHNNQLFLSSTFLGFDRFLEFFVRR